MGRLRSENGEVVCWVILIFVEAEAFSELGVRSQGVYCLCTSCTHIWRDASQVCQGEVVVFLLLDSHLSVVFVVVVLSLKELVDEPCQKHDN